MIFCANPAAQFKSYQTEIEKVVFKVMRGNRFVLGEEVLSFEKEFAKYIGTAEAVGVANGTDAIEIALRSMDIKPGDEVITVSHTAVATVAAIEAAGATPVLIDVDPQFYTLNTFQLDEVFSPKTKCIIAVHLYGQPSNLNVIIDFCKRNKIFLIEDVSQAHGAIYKGKRLGSIGDVGCFSCYPTKNLGAIGDAGVISTNNIELAIKIRKLREYGWNDRISEYSGRNSRLDELQAAVLRVKLRYLDLDNQKRLHLAKYYMDKLSMLPIQLPKIFEEGEPVFHLFVIQVENRQKLLNFLKKSGIHAGIHYPVPVHLQPAYKDRIKTAKNMGVTENIASKIISLPMYPELPIGDAEFVVSNIKRFYE
ncbi:MAG: DegT/DnrJ/EryC1/StrS family aminotransferase [Methylophilaceae bacterium]|jgi:dTDP-4-amino-4,6-dideoxygalactose transaminase|nr:DegT/DnrJ/EryC1/StrS family aminotransferase [Methylophilaceae bacterium]